MQDLFHDESVIDEVIAVSDSNSIKTTKEFVDKEGILLGISSGAAIYVAMQIAKKIGKGKKVLAIAPDGGEKYISMGVF